MSAIPRSDCAHADCSPCATCLLSVCLEIADEMRFFLAGDIIEDALDMVVEWLFGRSEMSPPSPDKWKEELRKMAWKQTRSLQRKRRVWAEDPVTLEAKMPAARDRHEEAAKERREELAMAVEDELWRLSPTQRKVYQLRFVGGFTNKEVAEIMGCAPSTVNAHFMQIKRRLEEPLARLVRKNRGRHSAFLPI
jgi:RNA polymerase sigma factor (sigma-70 family)